MVDFFYKILDLFSSFSRNGIFIKRTGLSSSNKLGLIINESSVFIVDRKFLVIPATKRNGQSACNLIRNSF